MNSRIGTRSLGAYLCVVSNPSASLTSDDDKSVYDYAASMTYASGEEGITTESGTLTDAFIFDDCAAIESERVALGLPANAITPPFSFSFVNED